MGVSRTPRQPLRVISKSEMLPFWRRLAEQVEQFGGKSVLRAPFSTPTTAKIPSTGERASERSSRRQYVLDVLGACRACERGRRLRLAQLKRAKVSPPHLPRSRSP